MHGPVYDSRAMIREATVVTVNDGGGVQTVDVLTDEGGTLSGIPVIQPWGVASSPPKHGLKALLVCVGGDPANMRAVLFSAGRRMGGMAAGEAAIYANNGAKVALRQGGVVQVLAGTTVNITAPNVTITTTGTITLAGSVLLTGPVTLGSGATVSGTLNLTGAINLTGDINVTGNVHATGSIGH